MKHYEILRALREDNNLTQATLASFFGVTQKAISQYELGQRQPSFELLKKYAEFFHVSTDYILGVNAENNLKA